MKIKNKNRRLLMLDNRLLISELISFKTYRTTIKNNFDNNLLSQTSLSSIKQTSFNLKEFYKLYLSTIFIKKKS